MQPASGHNEGYFIIYVRKEKRGYLDGNLIISRPISRGWLCFRKFKTSNLDTTTSTKLVKEKSFRFDHLGRGFGGHEGGGNELVNRSDGKEGHEEEEGKQERVGRVQNPKDVMHVRYAGLGLSRAGGRG
jgi:hypothetical protein